MGWTNESYRNIVFVYDFYDWNEILIIFLTPCWAPYVVILFAIQRCNAYKLGIANIDLNSDLFCAIIKKSL